MKQLNEIQAEIEKWTRQFGDNPSQDDDSLNKGQVLDSICPLLGMMEELGELSHVDLYRHQGRGGITPAEAHEKREDALADILIFMCDYANRRGINLLRALNHVWSKVQNRNRETWNEDKKAEG